MMFLRRHRLTTVLFALVSLLFMQLAVAGYVCPTGVAAGAKSTMTMAHAGMPCAESMPTMMDDAQPGLCQAHCQQDHQSADTYTVPVLPVLPTVAHDFAQQTASSLTQGAPVQAPLLLRTTAPPLAVRNCCFRT
jgi:hypothetical protein